MASLFFRCLAQGVGAKYGAPVSIALVDVKHIAAAGLDEAAALAAIAASIDGPAAINVIDVDAVTTTSDGVLAGGAIVAMAAADRGKINREFGVLHMEEMVVDEELVAMEQHLKPLEALYPGRRLFRGPDPAKKLIPVHNAVMTGKAINNNSATEMMNAVTMEEMLFPFLGQMQVMRDEDIVFGVTGPVISVGIGMTVAEKFGRIFPSRQFVAGDTAHSCGEYAKTLKANIPCIVAPKEVLARHIVDALEHGMVPGRQLGCSPAVLLVAHALGAEIDVNNITSRAWLELESVGIDRELLAAKAPLLSRAEVIARADDIIPGVVEPRRVKASEVFKPTEVTV